MKSARAPSRSLAYLLTGLHYPDTGVHRDNFAIHVARDVQGGTREVLHTPGIPKRLPQLCYTHSLQDPSWLLKSKDRQGCGRCRGLAMSSGSLLWVDKYRPSTFDKFVINRDIADQLKKLVKVESRPWVIELPSRKLEVDLTTLSSNHHVEINPGDVGNNDRYVVQEIIKEMAKSRPMDIQGDCRQATIRGGRGYATQQAWLPH
ncbi:hypothetical protein QJQ45_022319 [Haematococcus lacustris]|nr:hypothetical protein QJQ45_022319 [Haematococcus lacustris]